MRDLLLGVQADRSRADRVAAIQFKWLSHGAAVHNSLRLASGQRETHLAGGPTVGQRPGPRGFRVSRATGTEPGGLTESGPEPGSGRRAAAVRPSLRLSALRPLQWSLERGGGG